MSQKDQYCLRAEVVCANLTRVNALTAIVSNERKPRMKKPERIHLISEMPEPAAYGANDLTMKAQEKANSA